MGGLSTAVDDARNTPRARTHLRNLGGTVVSSLLEGEMAVDDEPFQSELKKPNPTRLRVQSPSKWRKRVGNIGVLLDFELKFSESPQ